MTSTQWINRSHPETLRTAVMLLYIRGAFSLLTLNLVNPISLIPLAAAVAAFGISQNKYYAWIAAVALSALSLALLALSIFNGVSPMVLMMPLIINIAQIALLTHSNSRMYTRVFFDR